MKIIYTDASVKIIALVLGSMLYQILLAGVAYAGCGCGYNDGCEDKCTNKCENAGTYYCFGSTVKVCYNDPCDPCRCKSSGECGPEDDRETKYKCYCSGTERLLRTTCYCSSANDAIFYENDNTTKYIYGTCGKDSCSSPFSCCKIEDPKSTFDCTTLDGWYGIDLQKYDQGVTPTCSSDIFYGENTYYAKHNAIESDDVKVCGTKVGNETTCQSSERSPWGDTIKGCTITSAQTYKLRTDFEVYQESSSAGGSHQRVSSSGSGFVDFYRHKYIKDYLGAKTDNKRGSATSLQEVKYHEDQCAINIGYGGDTGGWNNEDIKFGWVSEDDAKKPDEYPVDGTIPADMIREWQQWSRPFVDYEDFKTTYLRNTKDNTIRMFNVERSYTIHPYGGVESITINVAKGKVDKIITKPDIDGGRTIVVDVYDVDSRSWVNIGRKRYHTDNCHDYGPVTFRLNGRRIDKVKISAEDGWIHNDCESMLRVYYIDPPAVPVGESGDYDCTKIFANGPKGWYKKDGGYVWADIGCYYGRCTAAYYDPDIPIEANVLDPKDGNLRDVSSGVIETIAFSSDPEYAIHRKALESRVRDRGAMCEKISKNGVKYGDAIGPAHDWNGGEWYEFDISSSKLAQAIHAYNIKGWWISNTQWGHCCGDDDDENVSTDCNSITEDFDPITCQCVEKGAESPISGYSMTFRPDCAVAELNVLPKNLVEGQQTNIVAIIANQGDSTATDSNVTIDYGNGNKETIKIYGLKAKETRKILTQRIYGAPGDYNVTVSVSCPGDYYNVNDTKKVEGISVKRVVVTTAPAENTANDSIDIIEMLRTVINNIGKIFFKGGAE